MATNETRASSATNQADADAANEANADATAGATAGAEPGTSDAPATETKVTVSKKADSFEIRKGQSIKHGTRRFAPGDEKKLARYVSKDFEPQAKDETASTWWSFLERTGAVHKPVVQEEPADEEE